MYPKHSSPVHILVVRIGALGDTLMSTPVVTALRKRYPTAHIDFLSSATAAPLLHGHPAIDRLLSLHRPNLPFGLSLEKHRLANLLRTTKYDLTILLESALQHHYLLARAGLRNIRSFNQTPFDPKQHSIINNLRAAGFHRWEHCSQDMELFLSEREQETSRKLLSTVSRPWIGIHAGYGTTRRKKHQDRRLKGWRVDNFAELGSRLIEQGLNLILTGSRKDQTTAKAISARLPRDRFLLLAGRTDIRELASIIQQTDLFISVDSGAAHMAAALGTPLVLLWGPAILEQTCPASTTTQIRVVRHPVFCAPCYGTPSMKTCRRNICMEFIPPQRVLKEVLELLDSTRGSISR